MPLDRSVLPPPVTLMKKDKLARSAKADPVANRDSVINGRVELKHVYLVYKKMPPDRSVLPPPVTLMKKDKLARSAKADPVANRDSSHQWKS